MKWTHYQKTGMRSVFAAFLIASLAIDGWSIGLNSGSCRTARCPYCSARIHPAENKTDSGCDMGCNAVPLLQTCCNELQDPSSASSEISLLYMLAGIPCICHLSPGTLPESLPPTYARLAAPMFCVCHFGLLHSQSPVSACIPDVRNEFGMPFPGPRLHVQHCAWRC